MRRIVDTVTPRTWFESFALGLALGLTAYNATQLIGALL